MTTFGPVVSSPTGRCWVVTTPISVLLPLRASVPATTIEVGPVIQQFVGRMIRLLTGIFRHEADPFHLIWWIPCEMGLEGGKAIAVIAPITARRRVSDVPALVYKRAEFCRNSARMCSNGGKLAPPRTGGEGGKPGHPRR